jgi:hypothetical protein
MCQPFVARSAQFRARRVDRTTVGEELNDHAMRSLQDLIPTDLAQFGKRTVNLICGIRLDSIPVNRLRSFAVTYAPLTFSANPWEAGDVGNSDRFTPISRRRLFAEHPTIPLDVFFRLSDATGYFTEVQSRSDVGRRGLHLGLEPLRIEVQNGRDAQSIQRRL